MDNNSEIAIIESWAKNVSPWIRAVRGQEIESRKLVTNRAIMEVMLGLAPGKVLDIGCGEGWLVRELASKGVDVLGIDAIPEFIDAARSGGGGRYLALTYEELSPSVLGEKFDVIVCNFSLLGEASVLAVFRAAGQLLNDNGAFVIQTLHPIHIEKEGSTTDGWREGSWVGFNSEFRDPAPWYFRTIRSWKALFAQFGFERVNVIEPVNPKTGLPASIIFVGHVKG